MLKPIVLIGMMGSGKTTVGQKLATDLHLPWSDTDFYIEKSEQKSISSIFEQHGETYFRECETKALQQLIQDRGVISTGGGIIINALNRDILQQQAHVIYLETEIPTLIKRLDVSNRPLLKNENIELKLNSLFKARAKFYKDTSHVTVKTDKLTIKEVVEAIKSQLNQI